MPVPRGVKQGTEDRASSALQGLGRLEWLDSGVTGRLLCSCIRSLSEEWAGQGLPSRAHTCGLSGMPS